MIVGCFLNFWFAISSHYTGSYQKVDVAEMNTQEMGAAADKVQWWIT